MSEDTTNITGSLAPPVVDMAALREVMGKMNINETLGTPDPICRTSNEQSTQLTSPSPTMETAAAEMTAVRRTLNAGEKRQEHRINEIKRMLKEDIKVKAEEEMKDQIMEQIKAEIVKQVKDQMAAQIPEYFPIPLKTQAEESRRQLAEVKFALANSEARRANSILKPSPSNLNDTLAVVLKPDGTRSALYPINLRSLFAYDYAKSRELLKEFGLHDHGVLEKNLNRFMAHIGIRFELVPVPASAVTSPRAKQVPEVPVPKSAK